MPIWMIKTMKAEKWQFGSLFVYKNSLNSLNIKVATFTPFIRKKMIAFEATNIIIVICSMLKCRDT